jgi:hypothetical protein
MHMPAAAVSDGSAIVGPLVCHCFCFESLHSLQQHMECERWHSKPLSWTSLTWSRSGISRLLVITFSGNITLAYVPLGIPPGLART